MSLRTRLVLLTVALVVLVVVSLSAMLLNGLVEIWSADALEKCFTTRQQVGAIGVGCGDHSIGAHRRQDRP